MLPLSVRNNVGLGAPAYPANADPLFDYFLVTFSDGDLEGELIQKGTTGTKKVNGIDYKLIRLVDKLYFTKPKQQAPVTEDMEGGTGPAFVNEKCDWLTYETILNKPVFRKTNQRRYVGLYLVDVADVKLWLRDEMPSDSREAFCKAVFPDHTPEELQEMSDRSWWWKQQPDVASFAKKTAPYRKLSGALDPPDESNPAVWPRSEEACTGSRSGLRLHLPRYAVLPYNYWDNEGGSRALGTSPTSSFHEIPLLQLKTGPNDAASWEMWRTASRSCMMLLKPLKSMGEPWAPLAWSDWKFDSGKADREKFKNESPGDFPERYKSDAFKAEAKKKDQFSLPKRTAYHFSVKTGVVFVGFEKQPGKDAMGDDGEWLIGCMRSDLIKTMQKLMTGKPVPTEELVVQTEIAMILERQESVKMKAEKKGEDGVAFRDMSVLDKDRFYLAPLSIPFIGKDMKTLTVEFMHVDDPEWCGFWQKNWAEALGQAKGWFLMRYGMQHANPNVQNYLIEFPSMDTIQNLKNVKSRIIIRDVADALVVRQVMWALFGEDKACPTGEMEFTALKTAGLPALRFNFRTEASGKKSETGSTDQQFAKHGIHLLWQRFSAFYAADKAVGLSGDKLDQCPAVRLPKVLRLLADWLVAHAVVYVRTIEKALGHEFSSIQWDKLIAKAAPEERFPTIKNRQKYTDSAAADKNWEDAAGDVITTYFNDAGRQKICDYHNRGWIDATPTFTVRLLNNSAEPMPIQLVYFKCNDGTTGQRMSDPSGDIPFYVAKAATDFEFEWWYRDPLQAPTGTVLIKEKLTLTGSNLTPPVPVPTTVAIDDPGNLSGSTAKVSATVTMGTRKTLASASWEFNGGALGAPLTGPPYEAVIDTTSLKNGDYPLKITVKDTQAAETIDQKQVTIANPLPVAKFDTVAGDIAVATPNVKGSATAGTAMTLQSITITLDATPPITVSGPNFDVPLPQTDLTQGSHVVKVKAVDTAGNESAEVSLPFDIA